jgi:hypothetical protein
MLETHILERRLFPSRDDADDGAADSSGSPTSKPLPADLSTRSVDGSLHAPDPFQNGIDYDEPDEYANSEPEIDEFKRRDVLGRSVSMSDQSVPGDAQRDLIEQYVDAIAEGKKSVETPVSRGVKINYGSPSYEEESGSYSTSKASQIKQKEMHAWDMPKSPLDDLFRQTFGAMASPLKMPPMISHDIDDSTSQGSSEEEERDVLEDYYDDLEEGTDVYSQNYSLGTSAAVAGSDLNEDENSDDDSEVESEDDDEDDADYEDDEYADGEYDADYNSDGEDEYETTEDENGIRLDDLPDDFGTEFLNGSGPGRKYRTVSEPDAFDLDSLEEQLSKSSPNGRPSNQPSIDEILVAECLDNLIVLPKGETPLSSPEARSMGKYIREPHHGSSQRTTPEDIKGSPKFRERDPCTSSDEENGDSTDSDHDTNSHFQNSLRTDIAVTGDILLSGEGSDDSGDEKVLSACASNGSFDRGNRHIPPSPYPTDPFGFQGQIPFPQDVVRCDSVEECNEDEIGLYGAPVLSHNTSRLNTSQYDESDDNSSNSSSSSSGMFVDPMEGVEEVEQQMIAHEVEQKHPSSPAAIARDAANLSMRSMTSDDEREEDRRLFDAIMASAPPEDVRDGRSSDVAYMSDLMRATFSQRQQAAGGNRAAEGAIDENDLIHLISSNAIENVSHRLEDILYGRENKADGAEYEDEEDMAARSKLQLEKFEKRAAAYLASHAGSTDLITGQSNDHNSHTDIRFDSLGLAMSGDDEVDPTLFGDDNIPEFIVNALGSGEGALPVTGNDKLNDQFTQSFRELMQYYSSQGVAFSANSATTEHESGASSPKKTKKTPSKKAHSSASSAPSSAAKELGSTPTPTKRLKRASFTSSDKVLAVDKQVKSPAVTMRATPMKESPSKLKQVNGSDNAVDTSKHIIAGPKVSHGGREVYGATSDAVTRANPWNETGTRVGNVPTAPSSIMRVRYTSNSATAAAAVEKERKRRAAGKNNGMFIS